MQEPCTCTSGQLAPRAEPVTDALGWHVTTPSRGLAALIAGTSAGAVSAAVKGNWQVHIPQPALTVTVVNADSDELYCIVSLHPHPVLFTLKFAPWPAAAVLKCPLSELPARGTLSVRDVRMTTRMGRIVRYLIPEFKPPLA